MIDATRWLMILALGPLVWAQQPVVPEPTIDPDVQQLLSRETRQAAMMRILARGVYRGPGVYTESGDNFEVKHVVVCEQARGLPIFAVIGREEWVEQSPRSHGHLIQVSADGAIVRCWTGNNLTDGVFADINDDGLVERVETMNYGVGDATVRELFVLPISEDVTPSLRVAIDVAAGRDYEWQSAWRVVKARGSEPAKVQIGPLDPKTGEPASVIAEWRWNAARSAWTGPGGGPDKPFVRLPPLGEEGLKEFAATRLKDRRE